MQRFKRSVRSLRHSVRWRLTSGKTRLTDPEAYRFFKRLMNDGFQPNGLIDVVPEFRIIYVAVPKAASSAVKRYLGLLGGRELRSPDEANSRKYSGLLSPSEVGVAAFHQLVTAQDTLRFSFVRNPYERLVSCWVDKFCGRPLVWGNPFINFYLAYRRETDLSLPRGADRTLPFETFVQMAVATCDQRADPHWALQDDILNMPGIKLDLIGKTENFESNFARVTQHVAKLTQSPSITRFNVSSRAGCAAYFDTELSKRVYRSYERDFDRFGYPTTPPA